MNISKDTLSFLKELKKNNDRDWFQENKKRYQKANQDVRDFLDALIPEIAKFDPSVRGVEAKDCMFRIYRDVRFSKNKEPYKTNLGGYITSGGRKAMKAGYYVHIEPGRSMLAGGAYMPPAEWLKAIRKEIHYNSEELHKVIRSKTFKENFGELEGERLKTSPRDYPADHPEIELLRMKSLTAFHELKDSQLKSADFGKHATKVFKALKPLNDYLNMAMDGDES